MVATVIIPDRAGTTAGLVFFWVQILPGFMLIRGNGKQERRPFPRVGASVKGSGGLSLTMF